MRARKLAAGGPAASPLPDEGVDAWPADEDPAADDASPIAGLCIACGVEGCREHGEIARLDAPSRSVREAVDRLRHAAAEHRAAGRALRVLVLTEMARGRGELVTTEGPQRSPQPPPAETAPAEPCPRCALNPPAATAGAVKVRKAKRESGQQALPFKVS